MSAFHDNALIGASGQQGYKISRSVRLRSSASAYLNRTPASAGDRQKFTISFWMKRGTIGTLDLFTGNNANGFLGGFRSDNTLYLYDAGAASGGMQIWSQRVFRDPSAWYHIVIAVDTTQATDSNRFKVYINGIQETISTWNVGAGASRYPSLNANFDWNNTNSHEIGYALNYGYFDGYFTEFNNVSGQQLDPSSFGETDAVTGVWKPKKYTGTYGTNGFYLNFSDNSGATATTIGKDYSGNGNNWTPNNISVTAGVTYDSMLDVPTLYADGGNGRGNYATWNPLSRTACTITNGNLQAVGDGGNYDNLPASIAFDAGGSDGFYWEFTSISNDSSTLVGICSINNSELNKANPTFSFANSADGWGYIGSGNKTNSGTNTSYGNSWTNNDVIGVAVKNGKIWFSKNGTFQASGDPAAGTNQAFSSISGLVYPVAGINGTNGFIVNFGQRPFSYTPPTGFKALNTQNLPTPTISNGANYMAATLYTGNGSTQTISNAVNGVSMQPDFVWVKSRQYTTVGHSLFDALRPIGVNTSLPRLVSNSTDAETNNGGLTAFVSNGFSLNNDAYINSTSTGGNMVAWQWNAGGSTVTNTSGSISAQVRANATAGFSVVTYTGTGANATVGHGLGVAPSMVIVKPRSTTGNWSIWHTKLTSGAYALFFNTDAQGSYPTIWNSTIPTSTVFSIGTASGTNVSGQTQVAYCFAAVAGYSAFGSYTGNGSADGPFVFLGFRPRFVMIKSAGTANGWAIIDTARNTINVSGTILEPNSSNAEATYTQWQIDILSNGFKVRSGAYNESNGNGTTYIYAAFAENPFKLSLAR